MKIDNRLKKISEFVNKNSFILDVGCDHALLDIYLCLNKNVNATASDINPNPLEKAKENIKKYNLEEKITLKNIDGLKGIHKKIDTIVISGMGGILITKILQEDEKYLKDVKKIIICPNSDEQIVREHLLKNNYYLINEELVLDKRIIYPILVFEKGIKKYTKKEIAYGPILIKNKGELYNSYYLKKLNILNNIKKKLPLKYFANRIKINKKIRELKNIL